jgi:phosphoenolpyruvate carboxylase
MGVMSSRLALHDAMQEIGRWAAGRGIPLVFFHGSGGSVGRGGGSVAEQFATWPPGAGRVVKQTLQGEMVERTLATPEILRSQVLKIAASQAAPPGQTEPGPLSRRLARLERRTFENLVGSIGFRALLEKATPYARLGALAIGSRPTRRAGSADSGLEDLRAIPWVLCWTQTRYLLHAWLGAGSAWKALIRDEGCHAAALQEAAGRDPFLRGYLRLLGFTLAKTAPRIWSQYVAALAEDATDLADRLEEERRHALELAVAASPSGELLHDRVWLRESIHHRAPMIHPLNLLQIDVLSRPRLEAEDEMLFRETVTGIAAGMLTTG